MTESTGLNLYYLRLAAESYRYKYIEKAVNTNWRLSNIANCSSLVELCTFKNVFVNRYSKGEGRVN